jgi:hypothetical protein
MDNSKKAVWKDGFFCLKTTWLMYQLECIPESENSIGSTNFSHNSHPNSRFSFQNPTFTENPNVAGSPKWAAPKL